jgi:hypothetical protein
VLVRRPLVAAVSLAFALFSVPAASAETGSAPARFDLGPEPGPPVLAARATQAGAPGALPEPGAPRGRVPAVLRALRDRGEIDPAHHDLWRKAWDDSSRTLKRLRGTRRALLYAVRANVAVLARDRLLTASRAPLAFLTLERNRQWWSTGPLLPSGRRIEFPGSELVWQMYPGQGLQLQWLGTFGKANALWSSRRDDRLRVLLDEALTLAAQRAGGIAFEYQFAFGGGRPPWASAMAQATGMQALARASVRLAQPAYADAARAATGIFRAGPPQGVRVPTAAGAHYLIYSFAPGLRVLNALTQTVNGLHDFSLLTGDEGGRELFASGESELRATLGGYDTGAWSLYSLRGSESDLNYHTVARDFLRGLCGRLGTDLRKGRAAPDPAPYCQAADRFTGYLTQPPAVAVPDARAVKGRRTTVGYRVSKVSTVTVTLLRGRSVAYRSTLRLGRGRHGVTVVPSKRGRLAVIVRAVDLAGNAAEARGTLDVRAARKRRG